MAAREGWVLTGRDENLGRVLVGKYRIEARIGSGGGGVVYRALDLDLRRRVAIKLMLRAYSGDAAFMKSFAAEARATAQLNHPNIVRIYDWRIDNDEPFLVMELMENGSLSMLYQRHIRLSRAQVAEIGHATAQALEYAHGKRLLHRDIKPANLLFDHSGRVRLADFGLAQILSGATITEAGNRAIGTPRYMSPEQAAGEKSREVSDVYSLGLVLFEAATGVFPFTGDTPLLIAQARLYQRVVNPHPGDELLDVVMAMIERDPADRLEAKDVVKRLAAVAANLGTPAPIVFSPGARDSPEAIMDDTRHEVVPGSATAGSFADGLTEMAGASATGVLDRPQPASEPERAKRRRRWPWLFVLFLLLAVVGGGLAAYHYLRPISIPPLVGRSGSSAAALLHRDGFLHVGEVLRYSATYPAGEIAATSPGSGSTVLANAKITLVVSRGHAPIRLGNLVGTPSATALDQLSRLGFAVSRSAAYSTSAPAGTVISQLPRPGTYRFRTRVALVISSGPPPRPVPNVYLDSQNQASSQLAAAGFSASFQQAYSNSIPAGEAVSQSPAAGQVEAYNSQVVVTISMGPHYVQVPNVVGDPLAAAEATLNAGGFTVQVDPIFNSGQVFLENPTAGTTVLYGSAVALAAQ